GPRRRLPRAGPALVGRRPDRCGAGARLHRRRPLAVPAQARSRDQGHGAPAARPRGSAGSDRLDPPRRPHHLHHAGGTAAMNTPEEAARRSGTTTPVALSTKPDLSRHAVPEQQVALPPGQLRMHHSRRGKPPVHLADLTLAERKAALEEMGLPRYRAKQLSAHYFEHFTPDPE